MRYHATEKTASKGDPPRRVGHKATVRYHGAQYEATLSRAEKTLNGQYIFMFDNEETCGIPEVDIVEWHKPREADFSKLSAHDADDHAHDYVKGFDEWTDDIPTYPPTSGDSGCLPN